MKYTKILGSPVENNGIRCVRFEVVCSKCGESLDGFENFCSECGHKLKRLKESVPEDFIVRLLNGHYSELETFVATPAKAVNPNPFDDIERKEDSSGMQDSSGVRWETRNESGEKPVEKKCLHGFKDDRHCGHCTPNGACDVTVLTSMPPKYDMCPFRGEGFIDCKDA